jgi:hypothetical protein
MVDGAHLRRADSITGGEIISRGSRNYAGILILYFLPRSDQVQVYLVDAVFGRWPVALST